MFGKTLRANTTMQNGNTNDEKRPTFNPVIVSKPALSHPVIDANDTKQLLVCGG